MSLHFSSVHLKLSQERPTWASCYEAHFLIVFLLFPPTDTMWGSSPWTLLIPNLFPCTSQELSLKLMQASLSKVNRVGKYWKSHFKVWYHRLGSRVGIRCLCLWCEYVPLQPEQTCLSVSHSNNTTHIVWDELHDTFNKNGNLILFLLLSCWVDQDSKTNLSFL